MFWASYFISLLAAESAALPAADDGMTKRHGSADCSDDASFSSISPSRPIVTDTINNIQYVGIYTVKNTIEKFLNVPYGADTGGSNRFRNPQPVNITPGTVVNATVQGPVCPQPATDGVYPWYTPSTWFNEDCLKLKVARPAGTVAGAGLPVMVYIHGGSFLYGEINEPANEPDGLIAQSVENGMPVVFVAMNYRLNTFGFAVNDALVAQNSVNLGLKDQRLALEWVQENIEHFGGDPDQVTIFGQSSGGLAVTMHILAYGGRQPQPFHRAIMESASLEPNMTSGLSTIAFEAVATLAGCDVDGDSQTSTTIQCLQELSMGELWNFTEAVYEELNAQTGTDNFWWPVVDGDFVPGVPSQLVRDGNFTQMPIVIGWTRDDASGGVDLTIASSSDARNFVANLYPSLNSTTIDTIMDMYPAGDFDTRAIGTGLTAEYYRAAQIYRDLFYVCPAMYFGGGMAAKYAQEDTVPVYYYELNQTIYGPLANYVHTGLGVIHESEFPYIFADFSLYESAYGDYVAVTAADYVLQQQFSRSWSTFPSQGVLSYGPGTLQGWEPSYSPGALGLADASMYVIGGPTPGFSSLVQSADAIADIAAEDLSVRCAFVNSPSVIEQLQY